MEWKYQFTLAGTVRLDKSGFESGTGNVVTLTQQQAVYWSGLWHVPVEDAVGCLESGVQQTVSGGAVPQRVQPAAQGAGNLNHKVRTYKEYHSVCPSSESGLSQPLSRLRVFPSPQKQGGGGTLACGWGVGGSPNSDEGHTLWYSLYVRTLWSKHNTVHDQNRVNLLCSSSGKSEMKGTTEDDGEVKSLKPYQHSEQ